MIIKTPIKLFEWVRNGQQEVAKQKGLNHKDNPIDLLEGCKYIYTREPELTSITVDIKAMEDKKIKINPHMQVRIKNAVIQMQSKLSMSSGRLTKTTPMFVSLLA